MTKFAPGVSLKISDDFNIRVVNTRVSAFDCEEEKEEAQEEHRTSAEQRLGNYLLIISYLHKTLHIKYYIM